MTLTRLLAALMLMMGTPTLAGAAPIAVGARVPATFQATDADGRSRSLASIRGAKGTVLILFRSAKWCPYCQTQLKDLRALQPALKKRGVGLAALSYDPPATLKDFAAKNQIGYTLLSDRGSRMIDALGLRDASYPTGHFAAGVPKATILVLDSRGTVKARMIAEDYKVRPGNAEILRAVDAAAPR